MTKQNTVHKLIAFQKDLSDISLPEQLNDPFNYEPHPLCLTASEQLHEHLKSQTEWKHNFGLDFGNEGVNLKAIGKMFGVLVVQTPEKELAFLSAFSGKLANSNHHSYFVPPVYDSLVDNGFLNSGMKQLKVINDEVKELQLAGCKANLQLLSLKEKRKSLSQSLQHQLFESYKFLNCNGEIRSPYEIFGSNPPSGAGECAAPKLLQYAYQHNLKPISMAEFWWGSPPSSNTISRIHKHFYPACLSKCEGVLGWMLGVRD
ncbi:MAG: pseudouridylate synthase [Bacteroidetes bacterium]|nr:MAG: pseudouridylate synthase [Bacteroidota bacterium]